MDNNDFNVAIRAKIFARKAHAGMGIVTISGDEKPQLEHLQEVADLVWASGGSDNEIAAAWLHDSVEDTPTTLVDIQEIFGQEIVDIVKGLTDEVEIINLSNSERKARQAERIKNENDSVKRVKIADQISNVRLIVLDPKPSWVEGAKDYVVGAKMITDHCRGISALLDEMFDKEYERAKIILGFDN